MPDRSEPISLFDPVDDASEVELPPRLAEAMAEVRATFERCDGADIPRNTVLAAMLTELMTRLVEAHGPSGVASMLGQLAGEIATSGNPPTTVQ